MQGKDRYKWFALSATSLGTLLSVMTGSMLMIALPSMTKDLSASMGLVVWVIMSYMLSITILVPAIGRIADMAGRKRLYVWGFLLFTLTSLLAALARNGVQLLVVRIVQSVGGSLIIANSTAIVADAFPKRELGKALGINSMIIAVGSAIAPLLGGLLTERFGWRSIFFINVPLGLIGTVWAGIQIKETVTLPKGQRFDYPGAALFCSGLLLLLMALSFGGMSGWGSPAILVEFACSIVLLALFFRVEAKSKDPLFDLELFKSRILAFAYLSTFFNGVARGALTFLLIFYLQGIRSMDPLLAGVYLTPLAVAMMIVAPISGALADKYGSRYLSTVGLIVSAIGLLGYMWLRADTSLGEVVLWQALMGVGSGLFNSPNSNTIMGAVPVGRRGIAAGTRTMMMNAGMVVSIAMAFAIISSGVTPEAMSALFAGTQVGSQGIAVGVFMSDVRLAFLISFCISIAAAVISFMRGPEPRWAAEVGQSPTSEDA